MPSSLTTIRSNILYLATRVGLRHEVIARLGLVDREICQLERVYALADRVWSRGSINLMGGMNYAAEFIISVVMTG